MPVYVGKAEAGNSSYGDSTDENGFQLFDRVLKHSVSVTQADVNLSQTTSACATCRSTTRGSCWANAHCSAPTDQSSGTRSCRASARTRPAPLVATRDRSGTRSTLVVREPGSLCNRRFTLDEQRERIAMAVKIVLMEEGPDGDEAVNELKAYRRPERRSRRGTPARATRSS